MPVLLQLPIEVEMKLRAKASQDGQTLKSYLERLVLEVVPASMGKQPSIGDPTTPSMDSGKWSSAWRAWAASHAVRSTVADDSRESIYGEECE